MPSLATSFFDKLEARARAVNSLLCVGLDPQGFADAQAAAEACIRLVEATHHYAAAFKPNSAFFEQFGAAGMAALATLIRHIRGVAPTIPIILDAKRGDVGHTAAAYAKAAFEAFGADAVTLSPYMGADSIAPFLTDPAHGAFILCRTSNPGAADFQEQPFGGGRLYEYVAEWAEGLNANRNVGLVVGATDPAALARIRDLWPDGWFLVPGIGAQGGELAATVAAGRRADGLGLLINVSRGISAAADPAAEAVRLQAAIGQAVSDSAPRPAPLPDLIAALYEAGCVKFGQFTLKSGAISPIYMDLRRLPSFPVALRRVAAALNGLLADLDFDCIAGIPYAALPIATAAALIGDHRLIYPRREAKEYGTKAHVEGVFSAGERVVLIDDLATTGDSKFEAIEKLRSTGLVVEDIVVVIDREGGARQTLEAAGYRYHALTTLSQIVAALAAAGRITPEQRAEVETYLRG
jgi:uridine monophosphate synthetase